MTEFNDLGAHCAFSDCKQQDFLPFRCDLCLKTFCLDHRTYEGHQCARRGVKDVRVILCPICDQSIRAVLGEDENATWLRHANTPGLCRPTSWSPPRGQTAGHAFGGVASFGGRAGSRLPKCPVKGCKTKLTTINTFDCLKCKTAVCITHRHEENHDCTTRRSEWAHAGNWWWSSGGGARSPPTAATASSSGQRLSASTAVWERATESGGRTGSSSSAGGGIGTVDAEHFGPPTAAGRISAETDRGVTQRSYRSNGNPLGSVVSRKKQEHIECPSCSLHNARGATACAACGANLSKGDCCSM